MLKTRLGVCVLALIVAGATACAPERPEPSPALRRACELRYMVCHLDPAPPVVDGTDPLWTFCNQWPALRWPSRYFAGVVEVTWQYDDSGEIARVDAECGRTQVSINSERDDTGRVVRWVGGEFNGDSVELTYDDSGMVATSTDYYRFGAEFSTVRSFEYGDDGMLRLGRLDWFIDDEQPPEESHMMTLDYEAGELVRVVSESDPDAHHYDIEYVREQGHVVRATGFYRYEGPDYPGGWWSEMDVVYQWSGDELESSQTVFRSSVASNSQDETRYRYEAGRIAEVQRDRNGRPRATYWLDYDDQGRLTHLRWWGHQPEYEN